MDPRSDPAAPRRLAEIAELVGGRLEGDAEREVSGVAELEDAGQHDVAFCAERRRAEALATTRAGAVLVSDRVGDARPPEGTAVIFVEDAMLAVAHLLGVLYPRCRIGEVHADATVEEDAELGPGVGVGARAYVGCGARVGGGTEVGAGCVIEDRVRVGSECILHPGVILRTGTRLGDRVILHPGVVIGADGFGFARDAKGMQVKVPQVGGVVIDDDVEIGANSCVDRGTFRDTRIGPGTKIDNLVQIGHNCAIGANCALSGQVGLSGSTVVEDNVLMGGNVGTAGHLRIGEGAMIAAKSGVHRDVPAGAVVGGYPEMEMRTWRRVVAAIPKLPELIRRVRRIEHGLEHAGDGDNDKGE